MTWNIESLLSNMTSYSMNTNFKGNSYLMVQIYASIFIDFVTFLLLLKVRTLFIAKVFFVTFRLKCEYDNLRTKVVQTYQVEFVTSLLVLLLDPIFQLFLHHTVLFSVSSCMKVLKMTAHTIMGKRIIFESVFKNKIYQI